MVPKKEAAKPGRFEGFADPAFFKRLAAKQTREWFAEHKEEYEEGFAKPMLSLLHEARAKLDRAYPDCELAEPKVFRLHRDVRFSADKSPYKTHVAGVLAVKSGPGNVTATPAALYVHVGLGDDGKHQERHVAAGLYMMDKDQLARYRAALLDEARGREVAKLVAGLEKKGFGMGSGESLKRPPPGVSPDHPRLALLLRKGLIASAPQVREAHIRGPELVAWLVEQGKAAAPLVRWLTFSVA